MKKIIVFLVVGLLPVFAIAGDTTVKGHWKDTDHDGMKDTYIEPYHRTTPNNTKDDNYSTYPNTNPYTGQQGKSSDYDSNPYDYSGSRTKSKKSLY